MNLYLKFLTLSCAFLFVACGGTSQVLSTPVKNIDNQPLKRAELTEEQLKSWGHLDLVRDTVPGMSVDRTYDEIIKNQKGKTVIVAVIDSGVDTEHEDLKGVIWSNKDEIPFNGIDDDNNGYIDDIHGWNFLGDIVGENMEYVRIMRRLAPKFEGKEESSISTADRKEYLLYKKVLAEYLKEKQEALGVKMQYDAILEQLVPAHERVALKLNTPDYTEEDIQVLKEDSAYQREYAILTQMFSFEDNIPSIIDQLEEGIKYYGGRSDTHFNIQEDFRSVLGDDPYDITDINYGNNNVSGPDPKEDAKHGTHVSGVIAAKRNNGIGMKGVAKNVEIMVLRAVPDGDEYDKDIALAIRYAVDNGAKVINASFGKFYATNPEWVYDAIKYAAENDVLIVHASGNDAFDLDEEEISVFPSDQADNLTEISDNFLTVGALDHTYGQDMIASFSNYGKSNVDVFAPGNEIWATTPNDTYEFQGGTSFAAPAVAGIAAMLRSYYPNLTAAQVKKIIMESGLSSNTMVVLGAEPSNKRRFSEISKSGKMVNMYNAFIMAERIAGQ